MKEKILFVFLLFLCSLFWSTISSAEPPENTGQWELAFEENFDGDSLDWKIWDCQNGPNSHILSSRWKENVSVSNGLCHLTARKEKRGGQDWTAASIWVRKEHFEQAFGYWEARYKYAPATGLNQSFWMIRPGFEIDINEGHWKGEKHEKCEINTNLHYLEGEAKKTDSKAIPVDADLSAEFHTFACLWTPEEIVYYFDGKEIRRIPTRNAQLPVTPILSLAVFKWAGPVTDEIDGKSMDIDWVRVYRNKKD
ncbi:MAG: glycoside hydrolase family 16 protein [Thermoguttaceae bacterium]